MGTGNVIRRTPHGRPLNEDQILGLDGRVLVNLASRFGPEDRQNDKGQGHLASRVKRQNVPRRYGQRSFTTSRDEVSLTNAGFPRGWSQSPQAQILLS